MSVETVKWWCRAEVHKYRDQAAYEAGEPYDHVVVEGNLLMYGGASALWHRFTGGSSVTAYDNSNAYLGVGDSNTAAAATQTDLQAASNKLRKAMDATYPQHSDGTGSGNASVVFKSTFGATDANFAWQEWALFNHATTGRMANRKVESLGTKANPAVWTLTATFTVS